VVLNYGREKQKNKWTNFVFGNYGAMLSPVFVFSLSSLVLPQEEKKCQVVLFQRTEPRTQNLLCPPTFEK
jgi:hypothetical protein